MANTLLFSESSILFAGIPVHTLITLAISSATTSSRNSFASSASPPPSASCKARSSSSGFAASSLASKSGNVPYLSSAALLRSYSLSAFSISNCTSAIFSASSFTPSTASRSAFHRAVRSACSSYSSSSFDSNFCRRCTSATFWFFSASDLMLKRSISSWMMRRSTSSRTVGLDVSSFFSFAQASSMRSMALSGKNLSGKYRLLNLAAASSASSRMRTP
mmetsp:Transcript_3159/g.8069  ORF Transcript_3159/g.8069 Transcript_3159/m.8069 type:complete len:219 (+) Transcript_3159:1031-1687(+)